jgi:hypothetical protein
MGALKDGRFWTGLIIGALLLMFVPQLNVRSKSKAMG